MVTGPPPWPRIMAPPLWPRIPHIMQLETALRVTRMPSASAPSSYWHTHRERDNLLSADRLHFRRNRKMTAGVLCWLIPKECFGCNYGARGGRRRDAITQSLRRSANIIDLLGEKRPLVTVLRSVARERHVVFRPEEVMESTKTLFGVVYSLYSLFTNPFYFGFIKKQKI